MEKKSEEVDEYESWEEIELKSKRKREREAARLALDQIERSVAFGDDLEAEKEMGLLCGWSPYYYVGDRNRPLLSAMGLSLKHEFEDGEDEDEEVIFCGDTNFNLKNGTDVQATTANNIQSLSERQATRVALLKSRFTDVISNSQYQLGFLDRNKDLKKQQQPMLENRSLERPNFSSKDFKKQQRPVIKLDPSVKRPIKECKTKSATISREQDLKKRLIVIKKPRQCKSKLATIKASFNQRRCYMLH